MGFFFLYGLTPVVSKRNVYEFASAKEAALRRRQIRTRIAHKEREKWWDERARAAGIEVLSTAQPTKKNSDLKPDKRMLIEFLPENSTDKTIYSSHLLRIALLQGHKLESWQVYKAIRSAMQRRGYDANLPWKKAADSKKDNDEKENKESSDTYYKKLKEFFGDKQELYYPCYYEAYKQGIWDPKIPKDLSKRLSANPNPARNKGINPPEDKCFPSRSLVEKELQNLLIKAADLFPKLKGKENYILYGPAEKAYASYKDDKYANYRGTAWDWQGLLGQKIPRFDNRIISKCRLIPRLNVCKANKQINKEVSFLLALKNMRFTLNNSTSQSLNFEQIKCLFNKYKKNISDTPTKKALINSQNWKKYIKSLGGSVNPKQEKTPQLKGSGRSSFCKPALNILRSLILFGKNPHDYYKELVAINKNTDINKGLIKEDYKFLLDMPNDWNSISIQDTREDNKNLFHVEAKEKIHKIIAGINNRIVRHRLEMLLHLLEELKKEYGIPDKIVFEIAREDFIGEEKKKKYISTQNKNKKDKENIVKKLKKARTRMRISDTNILKAKLYEEQKGFDIYDTSNKRKLSFADLESYEIDHIVPRACGGSDSYVNFILTKPALNKDKGNLTPFEWFNRKRSDDREAYLKNVSDFAKPENAKKIELLTSDRAAELEKRRTDLQATSYLEKLAQTIAGLYFGFGINTKDDTRKIQFFTGGETSNIRKKLNLNETLYQTKEDFKEAKKNGLSEKNRKSKKHHALDALVLSMLPEIKTDKRRVEEKPEYFEKEYVRQQLETVKPKNIKQITPKLRETTYALRYRIEEGKKHYYFVSRFDSSIDNFKFLDGKKKNDKCARKNVDNIFDLKIKTDFEKELNKENLTQEKWENFLQKYTNNYEKIKKVSMIDSRAFEESEVFNSDGTIKEIIGEYGQKGAVKGQWIKGKEGHRGQILYKDNEKWKVIPVYVFESVHKKRKEHEDKYGDVKFFKSGQLVELKRNYEGIKAGVYKLRTIIQKSGDCKIEDINNQKEISKNINILLDQCGMEPYKQMD